MTANVPFLTVIEAGSPMNSLEMPIGKLFVTTASFSSYFILRMVTPSDRSPIENRERYPCVSALKLTV